MTHDQVVALVIDLKARVDELNDRVVLAKIDASDESKSFHMAIQILESKISSVTRKSKENENGNA